MRWAEMRWDEMRWDTKWMNDWDICVSRNPSLSHCSQAISLHIPLFCFVLFFFCLWQLLVCRGMIWQGRIEGINSERGVRQTMTSGRGRSADRAVFFNKKRKDVGGFSGILYLGRMTIITVYSDEHKTLSNNAPCTCQVKCKCPDSLQEKNYLEAYKDM